MKITLRGVLISFMILFTAPLFAREKTDVITLKNGDRITCEVKGLEDGVLSIGIDYVDGTVSVDWTKVARLESHQLFVVFSQDGSSYEGKLLSIHLTWKWRKLSK